MVDNADVGSNLPPLHPRCRCTIIADFGDGKSIGKRRIARDENGKNIHIPADMRYADWKAVYIDKTKSLASWEKSFANVAENGKMKIKGGVGSVSEAIHREQAVVRDNGLRNKYTVDFDLVNSKTYHDKYEGLTGHKPVDEALYKQVAAMLSHRTGSKYEDIAMLDARTGELLVENISASGSIEFMAGLTTEQANYLAGLQRDFEILHNHPGGTPPSMADIEGLFKRDFAVASTIAGHDGSLYRMVKKKVHADIKQFLKNIYDDTRVLHPDWPKDLVELHSTDLALEVLVKQGYMIYTKR